MAVVLVGACSNGSGPPAPPPLSVVNQSNGQATEVEAGSWCVDWLINEGCAALDGPVTEVGASCEENVVVAMPDGFEPQPNASLVAVPPGKGRAWVVDAQEGTVLIRSTDSGQWAQASWTFELLRDDDEC